MQNHYQKAEEYLRNARQVRDGHPDQADVDDDYLNNTVDTDTAATLVGTASRALRMFLRETNYQQPGPQGRYIFQRDDLLDLQHAFQQWQVGNGQGVAQ